ncbi:Abi family protein [Candidatus Phyllobacterium onerii]|uniref:Abi family protein n=1 Tax=Candidatus Phyllobacterium onerii TaxID=3020828 RepID=UPI00232C0408|nr:Abi family protein [Phyllobacterium sp. IY22]
MIADEALAREYLRYVGYYRLSGYMLPFQTGGKGQDRHLFVGTPSFDDIVDLYTFDRKLRLLLLDAIERIEIALRAALSTVLAVNHGPHWYLNLVHFDPRYDHGDFLDRAKKDIGHDEPKRRDLFVAHYYEHYSSPPTPPSWMLFEALSFGTVSMVIKGLEMSKRKKIAGAFGIPEPAMKSWPHCLSYARNLCAHHSRLWNRTFTIKPFAPREFADDFADQGRLYAQLAVAQIFMKKISPMSQWSDRLQTLLGEYPAITPARLHFPNQWHQRPIWR